MFCRYILLGLLNESYTHILNYFALYSLLSYIFVIRIFRYNYVSYNNILKRYSVNQNIE